MTNIFVQRFKQKWIKGLIKDLAPACIILFTGCFMLFFFEPLLIYATNMNGFWFDIRMMILPVSGMFFGFLLAGFIMLLAVYFCNLLFSENLLIYKWIVLTGFISFILLYLQGNWLSWNLPILRGDKINWGDYGKLENYIFLGALILLCIAIAICIRKFKLNRVIYYASAGSSVIFVMLLASLISAMIANNAFKAKDVTSFSSTTKNFSTISTNKNFLIFLIDAADSGKFCDVMNSDDDFRGMLDDFTYYPDTLSLYRYTANSIPHILSGVANYNLDSYNPDYNDYCTGAYNQSALFRKLDQNGYTINLYSNIIVWEGEREYSIENSQSLHDFHVGFLPFVKSELKYITFKYLPYGLKKYSRIEKLDFDSCKLSNTAHLSYSDKNRDIYHSIQNEKILETQNENYFQFVHCHGAHTPWDVDKHLNEIEDGTYEEQLAASLTMVKAYLQRLKDNNAYDNSVIVIMADHGYCENYVNNISQYNYLDWFNPALFIKGINEKHELRESAQPISFVDLQDAFCDLIDGKQSDELFADIGSERVRTVMAQWVGGSYSDYDILEYEATGKAYDLEKFYPTGTVYNSQLRGAHS